MPTTTEPMPTGPADVVDAVDFRREYRELLGRVTESLTRETRGPQQPRQIGPRERS